MKELLLVVIYANIAFSLAVPLLSHFSSRSTVLWTASILPQAATLAFLFTIIALGIDTKVGALNFERSYVLLAASTALGCVISTLAIGLSAYVWLSHPGIYSLLPLTLFGLVYLAMRSNQLTLLAAWLLIAISSYVIIALPGDRASVRAATMYGIVGMLSTLLLILGISLSVLLAESGGELLSLAASGTFIAAFGLKLGLFPFHWWIPQVYGKADGRPIAVLASAYKPAVAAALLYVFSEVIPQTVASHMSYVLLLLGLASITYGNVAAFVASGLPDLLAFSSIAHAGYMVVAIATIIAVDELNITKLATVGLVLLAFTIASTKPPLFVLTSSVGRSISDLSKISWNNAIGASIVLLTLSLLGIPPLLGFWGKLLIVMAVVSLSPLAAAVILINIATSSVYYLRLAFSALRSSEDRLELEAPLKSALVLSALINVLGLIAALAVYSL
ncbi:MAG: proton-conducting transporter membrane subunit [Acidilobaceae archaeon]